MLLTSCPNCGHPLDVTRDVPNTGPGPEVVLCPCGEAFAYGRQDIVEVTVENAARKAA